MRNHIARFSWCCLFSLLALLPLAISNAQDAAKSEPAVAAPADAPPPGSEAAAAEPAPAPAPLTAGDVKIMADTIWVMVAAMLVFFMNLGFACVESGMCRAKN